MDSGEWVVVKTGNLNLAWFQLRFESPQFALMPTSERLIGSQLSDTNRQFEHDPATPL
jgi:hypothetical protein